MRYSHLDMIWSYGIEKTGPSMSGIPKSVEKDKGGGLLYPWLQNHGPQRHPQSQKNAQIYESV